MKMSNTSVFELIHQADLLNNEMTIYFLRNLNKNMDISQFIVLGELLDKGALRQSVLAKKLGYSPGGMTAIANRLIKGGYAKRKYDDTDRRLVLLAVTDQGEAVFKDAQKQATEIREDFYSVLTEEEVQQSIAIQKKLYNHLMNK